jgi:muramidase (phage lysozyme)
MVEFLGLPPEAIALLEAISGTESRGDYNVIYGGSQFDDYSDHPRKPILITSGPNKGKYSTAAGKYQFLSTTWDKAKRALDLPDFSPESQDKAAWWLAQEDYADRTSGADLLRDLQSNDPAVLAAVGRNLAPTWTSLPHGIEQGQSTDQFVKAFSTHLSDAKPGALRSMGRAITGGMDAANNYLKGWLAPRPADRDMSKYVVGIDGSLVEKPTGKRLPSLSGQQLTPAQRAIMDALGGQQAAMPYGDSGLNTRSVQSVEINPYTGMPYRQRSIDNERPGTDLELGTGRPNFIDKVVSTRVDNNGVPNHPGTFTRTGMTSDKPLNTTPLQSALDKLRRSAETRIAGGSGTDTFSGGSGELLRQTPGQSIIERAPNSNIPEFITKTIQVPVQTPGLTASTEVTGPEYLKGGTMELHSGARDSVAQQQLARDVLARAAAAQKPPEQQFETQTIQIRNPAYVAPQQVPQQKPVPIQGDGGFLGGVFDTIGNAAGQAVNFVKDPVVGAGLRFMKMRGDIDQAIKAPFGRDTGRTYDADANEWVSNGPQAAPQQATLLGPVGQSGTASGGNPPKGTPLQQIISSLSGLVQRPKLGPVAQAMVNQRFADLSKSTTGAEGGVSENAKDQFGNWRPGYGPSSDYSAYEAALKKLREPQTAFSVNGGPVPVRMI